MVPTKSKLYDAMTKIEDDQLLPLTIELVKMYPEWLCTLPVTLGLLKAVHVTNGVEIRARLLGLHLLSFGNVQGQQLMYRKDDTEVSQCTISLPITGGLLALRPQRGGARDRGSLLFFFKKIRPMHDDDDDDEQDDENAAVDYAAMCECSLTSALVKYRPRLLGTAPINIFRKWTYISTQSIVHANVMWRFHHHLWKQSDSVLTTSRPEKRPYIMML